MKKFVSLLNWNNCDPKRNGENLFIVYNAESWGLCVDIGANLGEYSKYILQCNPACRIICFEPNPSLIPALKADGRFEVHQCAVGDSLQNIRININARDHALTSRYRKNENTTELDVPQVTLDDFFAQRPSEKISFVKIDAEGSEVSILKGARNLIENQRVDMFQFEYGGTFSDAGVKLRDVYALLRGKYIICHMHMAGILPLEYTEELETYLYSNWVAISRGIFLQ